MKRRLWAVGVEEFHRLDQVVQLGLDGFQVGRVGGVGIGPSLMSVSPMTARESSMKTMRPAYSGFHRSAQAAGAGSTVSRCRRWSGAGLVGHGVLARRIAVDDGKGQVDVREVGRRSLSSFCGRPVRIMSAVA